MQSTNGGNFVFLSIRLNFLNKWDIYSILENLDVVINHKTTKMKKTVLRIIPTAEWENS